MKENEKEATRSKNDGNRIPTAVIAGQKLKQMIKKKYKSQQAFADEFGADLRTVSRYCNQGISDLYIIDRLVIFFDVEEGFFFRRE